VVLDEDEFAKTLIPELFKHNNYASFVRQLNMYGFHKRVGLSDNSMKASERKNKSPSEYYNMYFKRGHPNLLWLINKPKSGAAGKKGKGARVKTEDGAERESDDEVDGVDDAFGPGFNQAQGTQRAISTIPESGPLQRREMSHVRQQLADIQKQQNAISSAISRLRKDHNQLYQQAMAFQTLHDRHESSINAILTFLATVYNRSLDGQNGQNIAQMFANGIPPEQQRHGDVVDIGDDFNAQGQSTPNSPSPHRKQRLLMAPPFQAQQTQSPESRMSALSPSTAASPQPTSYGNYRPASSRPGAIEELFDTPPAHSPSVKDHSSPQQDILALINNTNAAPTDPSKPSMNFPDVLSHYQNANGNSPLTSEQRNSMLDLIAKTSNVSPSNSNNALTTPTPPPALSLENMGYTAQEIEDLVRMQQEQNEKLNEVSQLIQPLSPSGSIPGLGDGGQYFNTESMDGVNGNLDLDQFLDSGAYYANSDNPVGADGYGYDGFGDGFGFDGTADVPAAGVPELAPEVGRIVETVENSAATTPAGIDIDGERESTPTKRQKKN
jgi:heat shock transcription factor